MTEYKVSLRTKSYEEAISRAARCYRVVVQLKSSLHMVSSDETYLNGLHMALKSKKTKKKRNQEKDVHACMYYQKSDGSVLAISYPDNPDKEFEVYQKVIELEKRDVQPRIAATQKNRDENLKLSEIYPRFIEYKIKNNNLNQDRQKEYGRYVKTIIDIFGDFDVLTFKRKDAKNLLLECKRLPKRNLKKYKTVPISELLEMEIPNEDLVAPKTVSEIRKFLQGLFAFMIEEEIVAESPVKDLRLQLASTSTFAPYSRQEVSSLLQNVNNEKLIWRIWMVRLAAFTGARRGELVQLRKSDIKIDSESNRYYIHINDDNGKVVKTGNAVREVPIHKSLIDMGFLDFAKESEQEELFPELNPETVSKWFPSFLASCGIERFDNFSRRKVFHSFRHSFITSSRAAGNPVDKVQQVVGHEKTIFGVTDGYTDKFPLINVLDVVDKVEYKS